MDGSRLKKVASQLAIAVAGGLVAVTLVGGGPVGAFNVPNNSVTSAKILNGEVKTADIGTNEVRGVDVRDDTLAGGGLTGVDIVESTLQNVNAGRVGGLQVRRINFQVPIGTGPTTVLNLAGLTITAECQDFGDHLDVKAFTSKNNASIDYFAAYANGISALEALRSAHSYPGNFDAGSAFDVDNNSPYNGGNAVGTLHYSAPDGSVVVVDLALHEVEEMISGHVRCVLTGTATGG